MEPVFRTKLLMFAVGGVGVRGFVTTVARAPVTFVAGGKETLGDTFLSQKLNLLTSGHEGRGSRRSGDCNRGLGQASGRECGDLSTARGIHGFEHRLGHQVRLDDLRRGHATSTGHYQTHMRLVNRPIRCCCCCRRRLLSLLRLSGSLSISSCRSPSAPSGLHQRHFLGKGQGLAENRLGLGCGRKETFFIFQFVWRFFTRDFLLFH